VDSKYVGVHQLGNENDPFFIQNSIAL